MKQEIKIGTAGFPSTNPNRRGSPGGNFTESTDPLNNLGHQAITKEIGFKGENLVEVKTNILMIKNSLGENFTSGDGIIFLDWWKTNISSFSNEYTYLNFDFFNSLDVISSFSTDSIETDVNRVTKELDFTLNLSDLRRNFKKLKAILKKLKNLDNIPNNIATIVDSIIDPQSNSNREKELAEIDRREILISTLFSAKLISQESKESLEGLIKEMKNPESEEDLLEKFDQILVIYLIAK